LAKLRLQPPEETDKELTIEIPALTVHKTELRLVKRNGYTFVRARIAVNDRSTGEKTELNHGINSPHQVDELGFRAACRQALINLLAHEVDEALFATFKGFPDPHGKI
jgi:hypothetical protein